MRFDILNVARRHAVTLGVRGVLLAGIAATLAGCNTTTARDTTGSVPADYRARHPIALTEGKKSLALFVGSGRGGLSPMQRAEVLAFAQNWRRDATGGISIDRPVGGANERAANDTLKETLSILAAAGIPNNGVGIRPYNTGDRPGALRLNYPQLAAEVGPCGQWPDDLGPSNDTKHFQNRQYYNFGCSTQRNLASMVANPADLVQPRSEAPGYNAKRTFGTDKWRRGESPATTYPDAGKGAISDIGK